MSRKSDLYQALKDTGHELTTSYRKYSVDLLEEELLEQGVDPDSIKSEPPIPKAPEPGPNVPRGPRDPNEMAGQRLNTQLPDEPIRVDDRGRAWFQEEVVKPAYPKPRGRRVLRIDDPGVKDQTVQEGRYKETFEVPGDRTSRSTEVKITLPSYQVGIYRDRRFPFKIHCYNDREGFDLFDVQEFFGGAELVPPSVKRMYVENSLCYDIRSVITAIQAEHRALQLTRRAQ